MKAGFILIVMLAFATKQAFHNSTKYLLIPALINETLINLIALASQWAAQQVFLARRLISEAVWRTVFSTQVGV